LLAKLPTFTRTIEGWLKAGSIELGDWRESQGLRMRFRSPDRA
jgi:RNA-directed DNA polymerase